MQANTWKYAENTFDSNTRGSRVKMNRIVVDHDAKFAAAATEAGADPRLAPFYADWVPRREAWFLNYGRWQNTKAGYGGGTRAFENLLSVLQSKPGPEQDSKIENWDNRIRVDAPRGSALYRTLLPQGRAPFSEGSYDEIINEVKNLGVRLSAQVAKPALVTLGGEVTGFYNQLNAARTQQQGQEGDTDMDASEIEVARVDIARALYGNCGALMNIYQETPERITAFFDLDTLRESSPEAPPPGPTPPSNP